MHDVKRVTKKVKGKKKSVFVYVAEFDDGSTEEIAQIDQDCAYAHIYGQVIDDEKEGLAACTLLRNRSNAVSGNVGGQEWTVDTYKIES